MPRWDAKTDRNHRAVKAALEAAGAVCFNTHRVGQGFPDLVCSVDGVIFLVEVKRGALGRLTPDEAAFIARWKAPVAVVRSVEGAVALVSAIRNAGRALGGEWE